MQLFNPKTKSKIKLIVFELPFSEHFKTIFCDLIKKIIDYHKSNIYIAFVTSHTEAVVKSIIDKLNPDLFIFCDGALIKYKSAIIYRAPIPLHIANKIISTLVNSTELIDLTVDSETHFYSMRSSTVEEQKCGYSNTIVTDFIEPLQNVSILKITPRLRKPEIAQNIIITTPEVYLVSFKSEQGFQFKSNLATRQNAINIICKMLKISIQDVLYIGESKLQAKFSEFIDENNGYVILTENGYDARLFDITL